MIVLFEEQFHKSFKKRILSSPKLLKKFDDRVILFKANSRDPVLKDHKLTGDKHTLRAFSIAGDIRVVYALRGDIVYFVDIGSHNQVY